MDKRIELLAPAGNFEKLKVAFRFGADAAYLGGKDFSLRSFADNFSAEELRAAVEYAHARGKKVYVTANIFAKNADFAALADYFRYLQEIGADAALVTDVGAFSLAKQVAPKLPLHVSTQANTTNKYAAKFWQEQGAERVVLARELSLAEISEIHEYCPGLELEAFVHGAMCISYSGRCLLSNYFAGRDSNRGECVQACRWKYSVRALRETNEGVRLTALAAGDRLCIPQSGMRGACEDGGQAYEVQAGDTLAGIAQANGTTPDVLMRLNPNLLPTDFRQGQVICLPTRLRTIDAQEAGEEAE